MHMHTVPLPHTDTYVCAHVVHVKKQQCTTATCVHAYMRTCECGSGSGSVVSYKLMIAAHGLLIGPMN